MSEKTIKARGQVTLNKVYEGSNGEDGVGIANTTVEYKLTDSQEQPSDDGWVSTLPNLGSGKYLWTRTNFHYTDGTNSYTYTVSRQSDNTYTAVVTNENIVLPADSDGNVTDFSNYNGSFFVYDGSYKVDPSTIVIQIKEQSNVTVTVGGNAYVITAMDKDKNTGYFDLEYLYKGVSLVKRVYVFKSVVGEQGTIPVIVRINTDSQVFTYDSNNNPFPSSQDIRITYSVSGADVSPVFSAQGFDDKGSFIKDINLLEDSSGYKKLSIQQFNGCNKVIVMASVGNVEDSITIVKVKDGSSVSPIPNPNVTISSDTEPINPTEGSWWNDTSTNPNILKYYYNSKWVVYSIDGYYIKANSLSGESIIADTLKASKISYENSDGTTTNLQTFDLDGLNVSVGKLEKKYNSLGQVNSLYNTEFLENSYGWYEGIPNNSVYSYGDELYTDSSFNLSEYKFNGSNVIVKDYTLGTKNGIYSYLISTGSNQQVSFSISSYSDDKYDGTSTCAIYFYYYDEDRKFISSIEKNFGKKTEWSLNILEDITPENTSYISVCVATNGNIGKSYYSKPFLYFGENIGNYVQGSSYLTKDTVLKVMKDNYTLGINDNGDLISGLSGDEKSITLKGDVIHLDGNTVMDQDFFSLWNGQYGSTKIDSKGMIVSNGKSSTLFTDGTMELTSVAGEDIGFIGRQVDSVYRNLDYLTFGLKGWHTSEPGTSEYDTYGGDGISFGISNTAGGYSPLLQWNSGLAASYKSSISGWLFTQPIVGGIDIYGDDAASNKTVSMRFQNVPMSNGFTYPLMTSQQAAGSTGIVIGSGNTYILGGNSFVWSVAGNGYAYYNTQKRGSSGSSLLMASDGAIVAQTSATKYKSDIEYEPSTSYGDKLLTIDPATWSDKNEKEQIQKYKDTGQEPEYSMNKDGARYYGLIAEDMVKAGLEDLIVRNTENGSVEGIQYEKIGIALIPLLREQRNQINELRVEIERLKEKNNE